MAKPVWGGIGAWAADAEREEAEELEAAAKNPVKSAAGATGKGKKMSMMRMPTGPVDSGRVGGGGGGFGSGLGVDRGGSGSWYEEEEEEEERERRGFGMMMKMGGSGDSRVWEMEGATRVGGVDNWVADGKRGVGVGGRGRRGGGGGGRYGGFGGGGGFGGEVYGGLGGGGRGDEVYGNFKKSRPSEIGDWGGSGRRNVAQERRQFRTEFRDSDYEPDRWSGRGGGNGVGGGYRGGGDDGVVGLGGGRGFSGVGDVGRVGGGGDSTGGDPQRPRLVLDARKVGDKDNVVKEEVRTIKGNNPFGAARPREEVLAEKGLDWKKIDLEIEAKKVVTSRPSSSQSSRPASGQSNRSESVGVLGGGVEGLVQAKPKVNPFGDAKPREVLLEEKGKDWRKIDFELEHQGVDRPETEEELKLKEDINHLKKELERKIAQGTPEGRPINEEDPISRKERELELLTQVLDDKVRFGKKAIERPGSGAGRGGGIIERQPSQSEGYDGSRSIEFGERPHSGGRVDVWSRLGEERGGFHVRREMGSLGNRSMDRSF